MCTHLWFQQLLQLLLKMVVFFFKAFQHFKTTEALKTFKALKIDQILKIGLEQNSAFFFTLKD